jgi:hypothetical protein
MWHFLRCQAYPACAFFRLLKFTHGSERLALLRLMQAR